MENSNVHITDFEENQYQEILELMSKNRGHFNDPKVGVFFMDSCDIFGVRKQYIKDILHQATNNILSLNIFHHDVWEEENKKKYRYRKFDERFLKNIEEYTKGRIFYDIKNNTYIIYTNDKNLTKSNIRYNIILDEFDIPDESTLIIYNGNALAMKNKVNN
jgi:hypothetical protein